MMLEAELSHPPQNNSRSGIRKAGGWKTNVDVVQVTREIELMAQDS